MSEYQHYEFLALDRPLTAREMQDLRSISSRAEITPTHFSNAYNYGNLRADPGKLLARYFDVYVYEANWGTREFSMRLPRAAVALGEVTPYCVGRRARARRAGKHVVIDMWSDSEDHEGWLEGGGWMASLAAVRSELLGGDTRPLYLAWLVCLEAGEVENEDVEPRMPPGLASLPAWLQTLAEFLRIDEHLLAAAAEGSTREDPEPSGLAEWITALAADEKDALLLEVAQGKRAQVAAALGRRFRTWTREGAIASEQPLRTAGQIRARADELREAHARKQARRAAAARRRRDAAAAAACVKRLDALAPRRSQAWKDVERLVASKKPTWYDEAVPLLVDLRDLAARDGAERGFDKRLHALRARHSGKRSFLARLDEAGLQKGTP